MPANTAPATAAAGRAHEERPFGTFDVAHRAMVRASQVSASGSALTRAGCPGRSGSCDRRACPVVAPLWRSGPVPPGGSDRPVARGAGREVAGLRRELEVAPRDYARASYGCSDEDAMAQVTFAPVDIPYAAVRRYVRERDARRKLKRAAPGRTAAQVAEIIRSAEGGALRGALCADLLSQTRLGWRRTHTWLKTRPIVPVNDCR